MLSALRTFVYDVSMARITARWYGAVLDRLPVGSHLLDVGVGTGTALARHAERVKATDLRVTGLDIDPDYIDKCRTNIARTGLAGRVSVCRQSVYDHRGGPYDAVYFSASFMLLPDQKAALRHVSGLLAPAGSIFFTHTVQDRKSWLMEHIKPRLHLVTTMHFGQVTYEEEFFRLLEETDLEVTDSVVLARHHSQSFHLVAARPKPDSHRVDSS